MLVERSDEIAHLGNELIRRTIEPLLAASDAGRFICVDVDTGVYEIADDDLAAVDRLQARVPGADTYLGRVEEGTTYLMGSR